MVTNTFIDLPGGIKCLEIVKGGDVWPLSHLLDMGRERAHTDTIFQDCIAEVGTWPAGQPVEQVTLAMQPRQSSVLSIQEYLQIPGSKRIASYHPKEGAVKLDLVKVFRWKEGLRNWYDEKTMTRDPFEQAEAVIVWSCYVSVDPRKRLDKDVELKLLETLSLRLNRNLKDFIATCKAGMPSHLADNAKDALSEHQCDDSTGVASGDAIPQLSSPDDSELSEAGRLDLTHSPDSISTMDSRSARMSPLALTFSTAGSLHSNTLVFSTSSQDEDRNSSDQLFGTISVIRMSPPVPSTKTGSTISRLHGFSGLISLLSLPKLRRRKNP